MPQGWTDVFQTTLEKGALGLPRSSPSEYRDIVGVAIQK